MKILLFGGTVEGRILAGRLAESGHAVTCSVATGYGRELIEPRPGLTVRTGRLEEEDMARLMREGGFDLVVDATHPYAVQVSENIRHAAEESGLRLCRLIRPEESAEGIVWAESPAEAARKLSESGRKALLTTGSKDLKVFTSVPDYREKLWVRILPSVESLTLAKEAGFPSSHIICMQGPFSVELNAAMLRQIGAGVLVTKDSGRAGGFAEKAEAARQAGAELLVIRRPVEETGQTLEELTRLLCPEKGERQEGAE